MVEQISHYKILKKLGAGGMGEVYLAEDTKLARKVALKLLPPDVAGERRQLNRFLQEARLAANLNHPHICTIYEIDAAADPPFLAMELVAGETLAERIQAGSLDLPETLEIAAQIADALDEAHRRGIIHRDIKSSNVIVNHRDQVKVLDFGLAKMITEEVSEQDVTRARTEDGMLVGTVQYMSPEQALGKKLDGRTDLWSLGVLLYEMLSGRLPFRAATPAGTFDEILHKTPAPLSETDPNVPPALEDIVFKLLEKDRDLRYQTASDLIADLKRLRRALGDPTSDSNERLRPSTAEIRASTQIFDRPEIASRKGGRGWTKAAAALFAAALLAGIAFAVWRFSVPKTAPGDFENAVSTRLTNLGKVYDAVISPDGRYIAYVTDDGARQTLWLKQTATGSVVQVFAPSENVYQGLAVSPDNDWIYFNVWDRKSVGEIFRIPALGGAPQRIVHDCMPGVSVSPDGRRIAFARSDDRNARYLLMTNAVDGGDEREVRSFSNTVLYTPVWTPDGKTIAFGLFHNENGERYPALAQIPADGGEPKVIWKDLENKIQPNRFVWLPDDSGFLVTLSNSREFRTQIWKIEAATGAMRQITRDLNSYSSLSITADGRSLLGLQTDFLISVWTMPADNPAQARRVTDGKTEGIGLGWTPDNRLVYASNVNGNAEIWRMNADGSDKKQLTSDPYLKLSPCVSGDGKYIFHNVMGNQLGGAMRMDIDGRDPQVLNGKWNVACAAAAPVVFYMTQCPKYSCLYRDTPALDAPVKVTDKPLINYAAAPDGKSIAYVFWDETKRIHALETMSLETGATRRLPLPAGAVQKYGDGQFLLRWTADGKNLTFANDENGFANVWLLPLNGEKPKRLTNFNDNYIFGFAWSNDGKQLAVSRATMTSDAILFKQE
ncbi:MAG: protein kinase [Acidobacteria bacterium]|nr:protein kinase [Acidobacteriota bacterium]